MRPRKIQPKRRTPPSRLLKCLARRDTWKKSRGVTHLLVCHDVDRAIEVCGRPFAQFLDACGELLTADGHQVAVIASPWSKLVGDSAYGNPLSVSRVYFLARGVDRVLNFFDVILRLEFTSGEFMTIWLWARIIRRSGCSIVVTIGAPAELIAAGNRLGALTIELLHGFRYVGVPWKLEGRSPSHLPKFVFGYDLMTSQSFRALEAKGVRFEIVRPPLDTLIDEASCSAITEASERTSQTVRKALGFMSPDRPRVLVALQWGYELNELDPDGLSEFPLPPFLQELIRDKNLDCSWVLRTHPVTTRSGGYDEGLNELRKFAGQFPGRVILDEADLLLPALLNEVGGVITPSSGVAAEALAVGLPVMFLDRFVFVGNITRAYGDELESGSARIWDGTPGALRWWITHVVGGPGGGLRTTSHGRDLRSVLYGLGHGLESGTGDDECPSGLDS